MTNRLIRDHYDLPTEIFGGTRVAYAIAHPRAHKALLVLRRKDHPKPWLVVEWAFGRTALKDCHPVEYRNEEPAMAYRSIWTRQNCAHTEGAK